MEGLRRNKGGQTRVARRTYVLRLWGRRWRGGPVLVCPVPEFRRTGYGWSGRDGGRCSRERTARCYSSMARMKRFSYVLHGGQCLLHVTKGQAPRPAAVVGNRGDGGRQGLGGKDSSRLARSRVRALAQRQRQRFTKAKMRRGCHTAWLLGEAVESTAAGLGNLGCLRALVTSTRCRDAIVSP